MIPYVIEDAGTSKEKVYDLYSRLLKDRIIFLGRGFDKDLANSIVGQLLFLEADNMGSDIIIYINSPGGEVTSCMAIYDVMRYVKPDISTVCIGEAASAAAFVLAAGTKGKRYALVNSRMMLHQIAAGAQGNIQDIRVHVREIERANEAMLNETAKITGRSIDQVKKDLERDCYMSSEEAKEYGLIDEILTARK